MNRNTSLTPRFEKVRDSKEVFNLANLDEIKSNFDSVLNNIEENLKNAKTIMDIEQQKEIYRYQIVKLESAFDYLCHSVIKFGIIKIFREEWECTEKYEKFPVKFCQVRKAIDDGIDENWVLKMVDDKISTQTFMGYKELKEALNYIKHEFLANDVACDVYQCDKSTSANMLENDLTFVYDRRNKIAHQNDRDHISGNKFDISETDVLNCKQKISKIVDSIVKNLKLIPDLEE